LETGGGLKKAGWWLKDAPFLVMNVDILTDLDLSATGQGSSPSQTLATLAVTDRSTSRYFLFDDRLELCGWRNTTTGEERIARSGAPASPAAHPPLTQKAFSGIHVISPGIFPLMQREGNSPWWMFTLTLP